MLFCVPLAQILSGWCSSGARPPRSVSTASKQLVRFRCHDEVVLVQTFDLLRLPRDLRPAPAEADVGMMALGFRQVADLGDKFQRFLEILEAKAALDPQPFV